MMLVENNHFRHMVISAYVTQVRCCETFWRHAPAGRSVQNQISGPASVWERRCLTRTHLQCFQGGGDPQFDLVRYAGVLPHLTGVVLLQPLIGDVTGDHLAVRGQRQRSRQRAESVEQKTMVNHA